jgi:hypothetical protein
VRSITAGHADGVLNALQGRYATAVKLLIHNAGVEGHDAVAVWVAVEAHAAGLFGFGHHHAGFHGVEGVAAAAQDAPGAGVGREARVPGGNNQRLAHQRRSRQGRGG